MKIDWTKVDIKEFSAIISSYLKKSGIEVVLVGGACVSIYSENSYLSFDIDLITNTPIRKIAPVLKKLGFENIGGRLFENPKCKYIIDFPAPPASIGNRPVFKFNKIPTSYGTIELLNPTDCVKDRLAAYFFWNDKQSLEQAVMVAKRKRINISEIKKWAQEQEELEKYKVFVQKL